METKAPKYVLRLKMYFDIYCFNGIMHIVTCNFISIKVERSNVNVRKIFCSNLKFKKLSINRCVIEEQCPLATVCKSTGKLKPKKPSEIWFQKKIRLI
jgi:hypothetical protein